MLSFSLFWLKQNTVEYNLDEKKRDSCIVKI